MSIDMEELESKLTPWPEAPKPALKKLVGKSFLEEPVATWELCQRILELEPVEWGSLKDAPPDCPWGTAESVSPQEVIDTIFSSVADDMKSFVKELKKRCLTLLTAQIDGQWLLLYVLQLGTKKGGEWRIETMVGGPPNSSPEVSPKVAETRWEIPEELFEFYAIHDGFGPFVEGKWGDNAVLPAEQLKVLPAVAGSETGSMQNIIDRQAFLSFFRDDLGRRFGFYRQFANDPYKDVGMWSRRTRTVSMQGAFLKVVGSTFTSWMKR